MSDNYDKDCIFCKIVKGEIPSKFIKENEYCVVFADLHPKAKVHLLVVPKKHFKDIMETDDYSIIEKLKNKYGDKYNIYTLTNKKELGYNQGYFENAKKNDKYNHLIEFFASIEILLNSELCFGSYTSNPSIFLGAVLGKSKFIEINSLDFIVI